MLTEKIQAQAIADHLAGQEVRVNPHDFSGIYADCWKAIQDKADKGEKIDALANVLDPEKYPDNAKIYQRILSLKPGGLKVETLDDIKDTIAPVEWLWEGWIPRGMITILAAVPAAGKTGFMLDLSRRVSSGTETWPDGKRIPNPGANVLFVDAEGQPEVIKERALSWKMKLKRFILKWQRDGTILNLGDSLYQDMVYEWAYAAKPELINVDSLGAINDKGENNIEDVRKILSYLRMLVSDMKCGLILSHHLRKRPGFLSPVLDMTQDDLRGSSHITAAARVILGLSVIQTTEEADPNGPRKLSVLKTNLGLYPKPLGYEIVPAFPNGFTLKWGDAPKAYKEPDKVDLCAEWLMEILEEKELPLKEIVKLAKDEDFSKGMILRARRKYPSRFKDTRGKRDPNNAWMLNSNDDQLV